MHLSKDVLKEHILKNNLVTDYADLEGQLTANGIDLRLAAVIEITNGGKLAKDKKNNKPPQLGKAWVLAGYEKRLTDYTCTEQHILQEETVILKKHQPYFVITCEQVNTPTNLMFHIAARTSLFRLTQSALLTTFGEAGYKGYLTFMLLPFIDSEIELGTRFSQITFTELKGEAHYEQQKETNQQGGKLF